MISVILPLLWLVLAISPVLAAERISAAAPSQMPQVKPEMLTPGFWISRHSSPDQEVMTQEQIKSFNLHIRSHLKLTKDIFSLIENFQMESLMAVFDKNVKDFESGFYTADGTRNNTEFLDKAKKNMRLRSVVLGIAPRYGLITRLADQRFFPASEGLYSQKGDLDFDELQNSGLDAGTPVAVVHESLDKKWFYVLSALSDGWVESSKVAIGDMAKVKEYSQAKDFVVVTAPKADIYLDSSMREHQGMVRMGVRLPLIEANEKQWVVQMPQRDKQGKLELVNGYIPKPQAHQGYLPYTARTIYNQAFLLLDKPYGWGDMYGQQDCSRFLQMIFATVGIELPRDSKNQAQVGKDLATFEDKMPLSVKLDALKTAPGALTILPMKGHIMLYLGMVDGTPFAMHESSGYSKNVDDLQVKYVLMRAVISDLSLGEGSAKGSLLKRLSKIVEINDVMPVKTGIQN